LPVGVTILNLNHLYFLERVLRKDQYD